ncbi:MAG: hypothetical protein EXX96DRAFT_584510 [Benjaminiella poitrasii]|nr:MAG: hypothetical protein EXX96DRAFT_584510 [Benjaminiella poitrasii]
MDIQDLLCSQQPELYETKVLTTDLPHQRQPSWSSSSSSSSNSCVSSPDMPSLFPPQQRTPWSYHEDQLLQQGYDQGLSWAMISTLYLPHRSRGCCWGRFKTLQAKLIEQREWNRTEDKLLMMAIKKHSRLFRQAWKVVGQEMKVDWKECELRSIKIHAASLKKKNQYQPY